MLRAIQLNKGGVPRQSDTISVLLALMSYPNC